MERDRSRSYLGSYWSAWALLALLALNLRSTTLFMGHAVDDAPPLAVPDTSISL